MPDKVAGPPGNRFAAANFKVLDAISISLSLSLSRSLLSLLSLLSLPLSLAQRDMGAAPIKAP